MSNLSSGVITPVHDVTKMTRVTPSNFVLSNVYYYRYSDEEDLTRSAVFLGKHSSFGNPVFQTDTTPPSVEFEINANLSWQFYTKTD